MSLPYCGQAEGARQCDHFVPAGGRDRPGPGSVVPNRGYRSNIFTANAGTGVNPKVSGGTNLGANVCNNALCL